MNGRDKEAPANTSDAASSSPQSSAPATIPALPITRRRMALVVGGIFVLWLIGVFARQVGEAQAAQTQADQLRARNVAMERDIQSLQREIALIKQPAFVAEMARGYLLGTPGEIPFKVDAAAPPLPADAPGSQGIVPETPSKPSNPLDAWLQAFSGPASSDRTRDSKPVGPLRSPHERDRGRLPPPTQGWRPASGDRTPGQVARTVRHDPDCRRGRFRFDLVRRPLPVSDAGRDRRGTVGCLVAAGGRRRDHDPHRARALRDSSRVLQPGRACQEGRHGGRDLGRKADPGRGRGLERS